MIMAPIGTCLFYIVTSVLQGEIGQVPSKLKEKFVPTLIASYTLWPAAHAINFKFVPSSQRILYTNIVSVRLCSCWTFEPDALSDVPVVLLIELCYVLQSVNSTCSILCFFM